MPSPGQAAQQSTTSGDASAVNLSSLMQPPSRRMARSVERISERPNAEFILAVPPDPWEPAGDKWLIRLKPKPNIPGCAGVRQLSKEEVQREEWDRAWIDAMRADHAKGWQWLLNDSAIPREFVPPSIPHAISEQGYLVRLPCTDPKTKQPGHFHTELWNVPAATPPGQKQRFRFDHDRYDAWREWLGERLLAHGLISPPTGFDYEAKRASLERRLNDAKMANWPTDDVRKQKIREAQEALDALPELPETNASPPPRTGAVSLAHIASEPPRIEAQDEPDSKPTRSRRSRAKADKGDGDAS